MRNPPIVRIEVADRFGEILYDSTAKPWRWRGDGEPILLGPTKWPEPVTRSKPVVRRYAPSPAPVAEPGARELSALIAGLSVALAVGGALVALALVLGIS